MSEPLHFRTELQRKNPRLPVFIRVPGEIVGAWGLTAITTVEGTLNGHAFGRRAIKDWGKGSPDWFVEFTKPFLDTAGLAPGHAVDVELQLADMTLPPEMAQRFQQDGVLARTWKLLKPNHQRAAIEHYLEAKTSAGRTVRLDKISRSLKAGR